MSDAVVRAVLDSAPRGSTPRAAREQLAKDWPTLAEELAVLIEASGQTVPPEWRAILRVHHDRGRRS